MLSEVLLCIGKSVSGYFSNLVNSPALISTGRSARYKSTAQRRDNAAFTPVVRVAIFANALDASCGIPNKYIL